MCKGTESVAYRNGWMRLRAWLTALCCAVLFFCVTLRAEANVGGGTPLPTPTPSGPSCSDVGHDMSVSGRREPTCTEQGRETTSCARCGRSVTTTLYPLGHAYETKVKVPATCTENGIEETKCTRCDEGWETALPALGHELFTSVTKEASCTEAGVQTTTCTRCEYKEEASIPALGHNLRTEVTTEATCEEEGVETTRCTRCNFNETKALPAQEHAYVSEGTEATCTEAGEMHSVCSRCGEKKTEQIEAAGHDFSRNVDEKEATCEENGYRKAICSRCGEQQDEVIEAVGHTYPEEWTVETQAGFITKGLESKTCSVCAAREEQSIPMTGTVPIALGSVGAAAAAGGGFTWRKKRLGAATAATAAAGGISKLPLNMKTVVVCCEDPALPALLKAKPFIKDKPCSRGALTATVKKENPDLVVVSVKNEKQLEEVVALKNGALNDATFGLVVDQAIFEEQKERLEELKRKRTLSGFISSEHSAPAIMVRLIAPHLKPEAKSDTALESIGMVTDLLGIPGVSTVIEAFTSGRELKETITRSDLGAMDHATIISDIANILGFQAAADVIELITEVDQMKENTRKDKAEGK